jgi:hypothetical protein
MKKTEENTALSDDDTDELKKTLVDAKGRVLGIIPLPEPLLIVWDIFSNTINSWLSKAAEVPVRNGVTKLAAQIPIDTIRNNAETIGYATGRGVAYAIPYLEVIRGFFDVGRVHKENTEGLLKPFAQLFAANKAAGGNGLVDNVTGGLLRTGYENNKMVARARAIVKTHTYSALNKAAINAAPAILNTYESHLRGEKGKLEQDNTPTRNEDGEIETPAVGTDSERLENINKKLGQIETYGNKVSGALKAGAKKLASPPDIDATYSKTSLFAVEKLEEYMRVNDLLGLKSNASDEQFANVTRRVANIFQTFQKEERYAAIPSRALNETAEIITAHLLEGNMHPLTLANVVGQELLLTDKKSGIKKDRIEAIIKQQVNILSKGSAISSDDFFQDKNYALDEVKMHLASKDPQERALVILMVGNADNVLKDAGLNKKQIEELRATLTEKVAGDLLVNIINGLSESSNRELDEMGLDREAIKFIRTHEGNPKSIRSALKDAGERQSMLDAVGDAMMGEDSEYWRNLMRPRSKEECKTRRSDDRNRPDEARPFSATEEDRFGDRSSPFANEKPRTVSDYVGGRSNIRGRARAGEYSEEEVGTRGR